MNEHLRKEIINHIFNCFGLLLEEGTGGKATSDDFLLEQKLVFEVENDKKFENNIWSGETNIEESRVQFIIADLSEDWAEYALLLQMDSLPPYAARISLDPEDAGAIFIGMDERWIEASSLIQAKILVAVESLMEIHISWGKNADPAGIHKTLINFLKFESEDDNAT